MALAPTFKHSHPLQSNDFIPRHIHKRNSVRVYQKLYTRVFIVHNNENLERAQMPINERAEERPVVQSVTQGILNKGK